MAFFDGMKFVFVCFSYFNLELSAEVVSEEEIGQGKEVIAYRGQGGMVLKVLKEDGWRRQKPVGRREWSIQGLHKKFKISTGDHQGSS